MNMRTILFPQSCFKSYSLSIFHTYDTFTVIILNECF